MKKMSILPKTLNLIVYQKKYPLDQAIRRLANLHHVEVEKMQFLNLSVFWKCTK